MSNIKISELELATELNENDLLMIIQGNKNKKITASKVGNGIKELIGTSTDPINANNVTTAGVYKVTGDKTNFYENDGTFILFVQNLEYRDTITLIQHMLTQNGLAIRTGTYEIISQEIYWSFTNWELQSGAGGGTDTLPIGAILPFSGDTAPENFLFCRGQAVSRTTYSELFDVIGTTYGAGDGSTTFNLPDLQGKVAVGLDSNDTDFDSLGETGGGTAQERFRVSSVNYSLTEGNIYRGQAIITSGRNEDTSAKTLDEMSLDLMPPYLVTNFIIKAKKTTVTGGEVIQETDTATTENVYSASAVDNKLAQIIESGSNANGNYIKYSDGTIICYGTLTLSEVSVSDYYSFCKRTNLQTITFPMEFDEVPNVTITNKGFGIFSTTINNIATNNFSFYAFTYPSASNLSGSLQYVAIGKWK